MSEEGTGSKGRSLPHIPLEILHKIADAVPDIRTAQSLARTCRGLRDAGEIACWRVLDLSSGWNPEGLAPVRPHPDSFYESGAAIVDSKIRHAEEAFKSDPFRRDCVSTLLLEPSDGGTDYPRAKRLIGILSAVAPRLKSLGLATLPWDFNLHWDSDPMGDLGDCHFHTHQEVAAIAFPNVTHFRFTVGMYGRPLQAWLDQMPQLRVLDICSASGDLDRTVIPLSSPLKRLKSLESIRLSHMENDVHSASMLRTLLVFAPDLKSLKIKGSWEPGSKNKALVGISRLLSLKTVVLELPEYELQRPQPGMDIRNFGKLPLTVEEIAVEDAVDQEIQELDLDFETSRMTSLQRLTILNTPRLALKDYASLGTDPSPEATYHIDGYFLHCLPPTPLLTTVLFLYLAKHSPSAPRHDPDEPEYFIPRHRWESEGHRGAIIRQYVHPSDAKEVFTHIRILSRVMYSPDGRLYIGARRSWKDLTAYKGQVVPRSILTEVYENSGEAVAFIEGGRSLALREEAWQILRNWRESLGVYEDEPDDEFYVDEEDTEDESESDDD